MQKFTKIIYLINILLLAFFLRIYKLDYNSLRTDECLTFFIASKESLSQLLTVVIGTKQQPLYYLLIYFWVKIFGTSEFSLRLPSVIFGIASVFVTYKLSRILFKNKEVGIISSCLAALSIMNINYSHDARPYTLALFLSLISIYFFMKVLERDSLQNMFFYLISSILLIYTHSQGAFTLLAQSIFAVSIWLFKKKNNTFNWRTCLFLQLMVLFLFLPWLLNLIKIISGNPDAFLFWVPQVTISRALFTLTDYYSSSLGVFCISLCLIIFSLFFAKDKMPLYLLLLIFLIPFLMLYFISILWKPVYVDRYTFCAHTPYLILVASGIEEIRKRIKIPLIIVLISLSFLLWFLCINNYYKTYYPFLYKNLNWKDITKFINNNAKEDDLLIPDAYFIKSLIFKYYPIKKDIKVIGFKYSFISKATYKDISNALDPVLKKSKRVWLLKFHSEDKNKYIVKKIREGFKLKDSWAFIPDIDFYRLDIKLYEQDK